MARISLYLDAFVVKTMKSDVAVIKMPDAATLPELRDMLSRSTIWKISQAGVAIAMKTLIVSVNRDGCKRWMLSSFATSCTLVSLGTQIFRMRTKELMDIVIRRFSASFYRSTDEIL